MPCSTAEGYILCFVRRFIGCRAGPLLGQRVLRNIPCVIISSFQSSLEKSVFELLLKVVAGIWAWGEVISSLSARGYGALVGERI